MREMNFNRTWEQQNHVVQILAWHLSSAKKKAVMFLKCKWKAKYNTLQHINTLVNNTSIYHSTHQVKKLTEKKNQAVLITWTLKVFLLLHQRKSDIIRIFKAMCLSPSQPQFYLHDGLCRKALKLTIFSNFWTLLAFTTFIFPFFLPWDWFWLFPQRLKMCFT